MPEATRIARIAAGTLMIAILAMGAVSPSRAEEESGTFNFMWENDVVGGTDRNYTNGVELSYLSIEDHLWDWFRTGSNALPGVGADEKPDHRGHREHCGRDCLPGGGFYRDDVLVGDGVAVAIVHAPWVDRSHEGFFPGRGGHATAGALHEPDGDVSIPHI